MLTILVALIGLIVLVSLHELGHFLTAKFFGVKVEEFGIGYPPRIFGRKFGQTIYSLNLLPFGAFVRIPETPSTEPDSYLGKPWWQRALILFNGAASFWLVSAVLFSFVYLSGAPTLVDDAEVGLRGLKVQISEVLPQSPAATANLKAGDVILGLKSQSLEFRPTDQVKEVQDFINDNRGQEITLNIQRGDKVFDATLTPRALPPSGQGPLGIALVRTGLKNYNLWQAPWLGIKSTFEMTVMVLAAYKDALAKLFQGAPTGLQLMGPIGIVSLLNQGVQMGLAYFFQMLGLLSINVAILNLLPIPAFDGGKLMFLGIGIVRRKPVSPEWEEKITTVFFVLLLILMVLVSLRDVVNLF